MGASFQVVTTSAFERDARRIIRRHPELTAVLEEWISILEADPYNRTRAHDITKFRGVKSGQGQRRIRHGDYRLRYDILDRDVVLYSLRHRREAY